MSARRLRWHGSSRQQALLDRLRLELAGWLAEWSVNPTLLSLRLADASLPPTAGARWLRATSKTGSIWFGAHAAAMDGLGGQLAHAAHEDALGLGRRVGARALQELLTQLVGGMAKLIGIEEIAAPSPEDHEPRFGACDLLLHGAGFEARLIVDNSLFEFWVAPQLATLPALASRVTSIGCERVNLDVVLDLGSARLADAQQLRVGDVLVSGAPIDSVFHLALPDSRRLFAAHLVRKGQHRALQVVTSSMRKVS